MSDIYAIGLSGARAYQGALTVVSENIANAQTAGYTRRTVSMRELGTSTSGTAGSGVYLSDINRPADAYRAADVRRTGSDLSRSETSVQWLEQIETTLNAQQIGQRLTGFFNAATTLAADPSAATPRALMVEAANGAAVAFTSAGSELTQMATQLDTSARQSIATLNGLSQTLVEVNDGLARTTGGTSAQALLLDQRDRILEQMSTIVDTTTTFDNLGRATVRVDGANGPVLAAPDGAGTISYSRNSSGAVAFGMTKVGVTSVITPNGGALAGIADSAQRIGDAKVALGALATDFADAVNQFQANGRDLNGVAGAAMFAKDPNDATHLTVTLTDPRQIAAAAPGGGTRDNSNLTALAATRKSAGFESRTTALVGGNATALAAARTVASAQTAIREGAVARYDESAGVNLDNEAVDLMRYQQAYQASARVIQVGRDCFQSILAIS